MIEVYHVDEHKPGEYYSSRDGCDVISRGIGYKWIYRHNGLVIDHNQYRHDLFASHNIKVMEDQRGEVISTQAAGSGLQVLFDSLRQSKIHTHSKCVDDLAFDTKTFHIHRDDMSTSDVIDVVSQFFKNKCLIDGSWTITPATKPYTTVTIEKSNER